MSAPSTLNTLGKNPFFIAYLGLALSIVILDQLSKLWIINNIELHRAIPVSGMFSLVHARNYGAAFGFLNNAGGWQTVFFALVSITVSLVLLVWLKRVSRIERQLSIALSLVLGGAIGNLLDRLMYNYVVDFLLFYYDQWHFPAFNIADLAISIGAFLLILDNFGWKIISDRFDDETAEQSS